MDGHQDDVEEKTACFSDFDPHAEEKADAILILGGTKPDDTCTYEKGYVKRQAIFLCKTCTPDSHAGLCYHCSLACHEGHEIEELHTKRLFRCDCGNDRFPTTPCLLISDKDEENVKNRYNHNFCSRYCMCDKPEDEMEDTMFQCNICEDWFHEKCLFPEGCYFLEVKQQAEENEITCINCMQQSPHLIFLSQYLSVRRLGETKDVAENPSRAAISISDVKESLPTPFPCLPLPEDSNEKSDSDEEPVKAKRPRVETFSIGQVWLKGWRDCICRCEKCQSGLSSKDQLFLLDEEDTMAHYDKIGHSVLDEMENKVIDDFLTNSDVQYRNSILEGINKLKKSFSKFMESIANEGKGTSDNPITSEDVMHFCTKIREADLNESEEEEEESHGSS